ncbi:MAG: leucine-rich repeat protein [Bacteroidetes bacterium]|nr:leucine-rich repeat protein [Bacteroidota bacterium]
MKTHKFIFTTAILLLSALYTSANCFTVDGLDYCIIEETDNVAVSKGSDYSYSSYKGADIVIPETVSWEGNVYQVTKIADYGFWNASMKSIVLPNTLKGIEYAAFEFSYIESIIIPASVEYISDWAFTKCPYLRSIVFEGPVYIGMCAFAGWAASPVPYTIEVKCDPFIIWQGFALVDLENSTLIVPNEKEELYRDTWPWQNFGTILEKSQFVPVTNIFDVPTEIITDTPLIFTGKVFPSDATCQTIVWSVNNASGVWFSHDNTTDNITINIYHYSHYSYYPNSIKTVEITATVLNGTAVGVNYTQNFIITVNDPVAYISDVPTETTVGTPLTLTGGIGPYYATQQTIAWSVNDAGTTGAWISNDTLYTSMPGTVEITATVANGAAGGVDYTQNFSIEVNVPVKDITDVPTETTVGTPLTLTGTVIPDNATQQTIVWFVNDAGTTGAWISNDILYTSAAGTVEITAYIMNGIAFGVNYTQNFSIEVNVPVTDITDVPTETTVGTPLTLTGKVTPENATRQTIIWSVKDAGTTGASISNNILYTSAAGTVVITATIANGAEGGVDYTQIFSIEVNVPVTNITGVPTETTVDIPLTLTGKVTPENATRQTIVWSVNDAGTTGAWISGNNLHATTAGTVEITATISNGAADGTDYTQNFSITVVDENTGITETTQQSKLIVYPNPTKGQLTISGVETLPATSSQIVEIYNNAGRLVGVEYFRPLQSTHDTRVENIRPLQYSNRLTIDISHLPNGVYFIQTNGQRVKVVKQ